MCIDPSMCHNTLYQFLVDFRKVLPIAACTPWPTPETSITIHFSEKLPLRGPHTWPLQHHCRQRFSNLTQSSAIITDMLRHNGRVPAQIYPEWAPVNTFVTAVMEIDPWDWTKRPPGNEGIVSRAARGCFNSKPIVRQFPLWRKDDLKIVFPSYGNSHIDDIKSE